ncbi:hypothetical protein [Catellatospora sp. NPDC049609]|uniref:hypothetical protein n=1 Tax=Catellatospora sp. NPDC049609 TaxID=3155505 RepID=UPI0034120B2D
MKAHSPLDPSEWDELAALLPDPGHRELPPGRHELHRERLLAAITPPGRTASSRRGRVVPGLSAWRGPGLRRPALALAALVAVVGTAAAVVATADRGPVTAIPSAAPSAPALTPTGEGGVTAKVRGYGTVRQLTAAADLVVRGEVVRVAGAGPDRAAVLRVDEVLHRAPGLPAAAEITLRTPATEGMSLLEAGQTVVLYLAHDAGSGSFGPLSGDFGVFDVTGDIATARSQTRSVTGLRDEDAANAGRAFTTTLADLRTLAREKT